MQLTYDPRHDIAYLRLHEKTDDVETIQVSEDLNIDIAPNGAVCGIELLNANQQVRAEDQGKLAVMNETLDARQKVLLAQ